MTTETWQNKAIHTYMITLKWNGESVRDFKITARNGANANWIATQIAISLDLPNHVCQIERVDQ
jgi:hypothetical protein